MSSGRQPGEADRQPPLIIWLLPLVFACLLPGLVWVWAERPMATRPRLLLAMALGTAIVAAVTLVVLHRASHRQIRWSLGVTAITMLVLFQWPTLGSAGNLVATSMRMPLLEDALPVLIAVGFLWVAVRVADDWQFAALIGAALGIATVALLVNIVPRSINPPVTAAGQPTADAPDVVLLIFDGYTRSDVLLDRFEFDNSDFTTGIEQLGFAVADRATANYNYTYAAIASMLELDYVFSAGALGNTDMEAMRQALSGYPELYKRFHEAGYEIAYAENYWSGSHCGPAVDICWRDGRAEQVIWNLGRMTILAPLVGEVRPHPFNPISFSHLEALPDMVTEGRTPGVPRLTVAHIILPHQPYLLDAACERQSGPARDGLTITNPDFVAPRQQYMVDQLVCTNSMILNALQQITDGRPDTLIMVTADHGSDTTRVDGVSGEWSDVEVNERMSILGAYRMPGCNEELSAATTPVNGIRAVTNCALGTELPRLPDVNYWVPPSGELGPVTDISGDLYASG